MRIITFCIIITLLNLPAIALNRDDFPSDLQKVLDEKTNELKTNRGIFIAGRVTLDDGAPISGGKDVMVNLIHNFNDPLRVYKDGWFMMRKVISPNYKGDDGKIIFRAFGYEPNDMSIKILNGEITYLEFVMRKIPDDSSATVTGIIVNDQNEPFEGAHVSLSFPFPYLGTSNNPFKSYITGKDGQFSFTDLPAAKLSLDASSPGYAYHSVEIKPAAGETVEQNLKLYKNQKIIIDYVYQADGNSSFGGGEFQTGTIEWTNGQGGLDFSDEKVEGYEPKSLRDIELIQDQNNLKFKISYVSGNGFYDAGAVDFDSVTEAAKSGYNITQQPCITGHVYVVRTYEKKYAKFIVRSISRIAKSSAKDS